MASVSMDARMRPPETMRLLMKRWQKSTLGEIDTGNDILDLASGKTHLSQDVTPAEGPSTETVDGSFRKFVGFMPTTCQLPRNRRYSCFEVKSLPGLFVYPSLLPGVVQIELLDRILHRDLSNPIHNNNLNLHYDVPYPASSSTDIKPQQCRSFFEMDKQTQLKPKDPAIHKPLSIDQMLERKLRWITLGGQYDWTAKLYPSEKPPAFPSDVGNLLGDIWSNVDAQAAIVNFYTPGDTLSVHRDVSEECDRGLISISIGCDALFIIGNQEGTSHVTLRLRSGDAVLMSGQSRFAWHAVPRVLANTCPQQLQDWPCLSNTERFSAWKGWLRNKRINLNVRQMRLDH